MPLFDDNYSHLVFPFCRAVEVKRKRSRSKQLFSSLNRQNLIDILLQVLPLGAVCVHCYKLATATPLSAIEGFSSILTMITMVSLTSIITTGLLGFLQRKVQTRISERIS